MHQINLIRRELREYLPWHGARLDLLALLLVALYRARTVNLTALASVFSNNRQWASNSKRLYRFFRHYDFSESMVTKAVVKMLNIPQPWTLSLDRTNWSFGQCHINILCLGVVYEGIAIPLVWTMLDKRGNSNTAERMDLVDRFEADFPDVNVKYLTADREFIGKEWFTYLMMSSRIPMLIRIKKNFLMSSTSGRSRRAAGHYFQDLDFGQSRLLSKPRWVCGRRLWVHGTRLRDNQLLILVSQRRPSTPLADYAQRWGIETLFGVLKTRGFCLESTHFTHMERLSKLFAILTLAMAWALKAGLWLHRQKPIPVKKHGYKAKSFFRHGLDFLRQIVSNFSLFPQRFALSLHFLSSS